MNAFELFFSLFGLILGLAVARVIGGLSDVLGERKHIKIGLLTPMLAVFLLIELSSVWVNAWSGLTDIQVAYGPFVAATMVAAIYFFGAAMIFPKVPADWETLDHYYMTHYRWVIGAVILANIGLLLIEVGVTGNWALLRQSLTSSPITLLWWAILASIWLIRRKWFQILGLVSLQLVWIYILLVRWA